MGSINWQSLKWLILEDLANSAVFMRADGSVQSYTVQIDTKKQEVVLKTQSNQGIECSAILSDPSKLGAESLDELGSAVAKEFRKMYPSAKFDQR